MIFFMSGKMRHDAELENVKMMNDKKMRLHLESLEQTVTLIGFIFKSNQGFRDYNATRVKFKRILMTMFVEPWTTHKDNLSW